jgi:hypothetical protein
METVCLSVSAMEAATSGRKNDKPELFQQNPTQVASLEWGFSQTGAMAVSGELA